MRLRWLLLLLPLLGACRAPDDGAIRFALATMPASLDPRFATDAASERINRLLYRRLVDFDEHARPQPALATWERLSPRHYRFHLGREGRRFTDGSRLTAADVAATYRSVLDPATGSPQRGTLALIGGIEVLDEDTLDFHLDRADALFPAYLGIGILPAAAIADGRRVDRHPVGSGPFAFRAWEEGGALELERRSDGQRLEFLKVHDPTMRVLKLMRGEVDLLQNDLPPELFAWLREQRGIRTATRPGSNFAYLGFQLEDPDTGRPAVRRAVALAIDRDAIIRYLFRGAARPASALLPPEHWAGNDRLPLLQRDLGQARRLLAAAGYDRAHPLHLSYKTSSDPFRLRIASVIQQQLAQAGIEVAVQSYDWGTFYGDIKKGRFQMYSLAWVGVKSPDIFRYAFHSASLPPAGANRGRLRDAAVDALIERAMAAQDLEEQARLYARLQALLLERLPVVPLWYEDQFYAAGNRISGYHLGADGNYDALVQTRKRR